MRPDIEPNYHNIVQLLEQGFSGDATHTIDHVFRVYNNALKIARGENGVDLHVLKLAVLLHDIARGREDADNTGRSDHATMGAEMAAKILEELKYEKGIVERVAHCIAAHRYRSGLKPETIEAQILYEADKIDLLGAIGVARSFMIAGEQGQQLYSRTNLDDYIRDNSVDGKPDGRIKEISRHTANIEYEIKIKNIPSKIKTETGKKIAEERLGIMADFFARLRQEIEGCA